MLSVKYLVAASLAAALLAPVAGLAQAPAPGKTVDIPKPETRTQPKANNPGEKALYDAASALGMVRWNNGQRKLFINVIDVIDFTGSGVLSGEKVNRATIGYDFVLQAARIDTEKSGSDGKPVREIQVASKGLSWDESTPGVFQKAGATTADERLRQMWLLPWAFVLSGSQALDKLKLETAGADRELTVTTPGGVAVKARLDKNGFPVHTEMQAGGKAWTGDFSDFVIDGEDYNFYFPRHLVLKADGQVVTDLTIGKLPADKKLDLPEGNNIFPNPYVIFPVPKEMAKK